MLRFNIITISWGICLGVKPVQQSPEQRNEHLYHKYGASLSILERPKKFKSCIVMEGDNTKAEPSRLLLLNSFISLSSVLQQNLLSPFCGGSQVYQTFFAARMTSWLDALDTHFFTKRYDALVSYWDKCHRRGDDCVEK